MGREDNWKTYWLTELDKIDCNRFSPREPIIIKSASISSATWQTTSLGSPWRKIEETWLGSKFKYWIALARILPPSSHLSVMTAAVLCGVTTWRTVTLAPWNEGISFKFLSISSACPKPETANKIFWIIFTSLSWGFLWFLLLVLSYGCTKQAIRMFFSDVLNNQVKYLGINEPISSKTNTNKQKSDQY